MQPLRGLRVLIAAFSAATAMRASIDAIDRRLLRSEPNIWTRVDAVGQK